MERGEEHEKELWIFNFYGFFLAAFDLLSENSSFTRFSFSSVKKLRLIHFVSDFWLIDSWVVFSLIVGLPILFFLYCWWSPNSVIHNPWILNITSKSTVNFINNRWWIPLSNDQEFYNKILGEFHKQSPMNSMKNRPWILQTIVHEFHCRSLMNFMKNRPWIS